MRLIDVVNHDIVEYINNLPEYAILSHTWEGGEVTLQDVTNGTHTWKRGWDKVIKCCELARRDGYWWLWIDTCCIDKTSSSELSEAINSMYQWYENAQICYVYLADCGGLDYYQFINAVHHRRGWTLQELLAPKHVVFVVKSWEEIGTRQSLSDWITVATGIPVGALDGRHMTYTAAQKMSWACYRETERVEDLAYSLLGLFQINMPLLYGEGLRAFRRLQMEIIRNSDDETVLAHGVYDYYRDRAAGLLARSPRDFFASGNILQLSDRPHKRHNVSITERGFELRSLLYRTQDDHSSRPTYLMRLNCTDGNGRTLILPLETNTLSPPFQFYIKPHQPCWMRQDEFPTKGSMQEFSISLDDPTSGDIVPAAIAVAPSTAPGPLITPFWHSSDLRPISLDVSGNVREANIHENDVELEPPSCPSLMFRTHNDSGDFAARGDGLHYDLHVNDLKLEPPSCPSLMFLSQNGSGDFAARADGLHYDLAFEVASHLRDRVLLTVRLTRIGDNVPINSQTGNPWAEQLSLSTRSHDEPQSSSQGNNSLHFGNKSQQYHTHAFLTPCGESLAKAWRLVVMSSATRWLHPEAKFSDGSPVKPHSKLIYRDMSSIDGFDD